jgi:hypothetical protein
MIPALDPPGRAGEDDLGHLKPRLTARLTVGAASLLDETGGSA